MPWPHVSWAQGSRVGAWARRPSYYPTPSNTTPHHTIPHPTPPSTPLFTPLHPASCSPPPPLTPKLSTLRSPLPLRARCPPVPSPPRVSPTRVRTLHPSTQTPPSYHTSPPLRAVPAPIHPSTPQPRSLLTPGMSLSGAPPSKGPWSKGVGVVAAAGRVLGVCKSEIRCPIPAPCGVLKK